jgi:hypothetical protein
MSKRSTANEEAPIRGPAWSKAPIVSESIGVQVREIKGLSALQKEFNGIYDQFKKGFETEASVAVNSAQTSKSSLASGDSSTTPGAFDFLDDRKK